MNSLARTWLRRIALGLPLATASLTLTACPFGGDCGSIEERSYTISAEQRAMILVDGGQSDAGLGDAGVTSCFQLCDLLEPEYFSAVTACSVDETGAEPVLNCTFENYCIGGRRPAGLIASAGRARDAVGRFLADCARLEAASVPAFAELAHELTLHGAPGALVRGARRAARDEARHAREVARLAHRFGARPAAVTREAIAPRTLRAIAEDNAAEGCTREAYAALMAARQAMTAEDPIVARTYAGIARDEARHALWSFALDRWAHQKLPARHAREVEEVRRESLASLSSALEREPSIELRSVLGVPNAERAMTLARALA